MFPQLSLQCLLLIPTAFGTNLKFVRKRILTDEQLQLYSNLDDSVATDNITAVQESRAVNKSTNCSHITFNQKPTARTVITSFPGSGNIWLRHLIHMATGFYTGSIYHDGKLLEEGFKGEELEWNDPTVLGVKMHGFGMARKLSASQSESIETTFPQILLLIRSPYHVLLSEFNRVHNYRHSHIGAADAEYFTNGTFEAFVEEQIPRWSKSIEKWMLNYRGRVHVVCFENMHSNTLETMEGVVQFLDVPFSRPECIATGQTANGRFKRHTGGDFDLDEFFATREQLQEKVKRAIDHVAWLLAAKRKQDCTKYF